LKLAICNDFVNHHDISYFIHTSVNLASFSDYEPELHNLSNHFLMPELLELSQKGMLNAQRQTWKTSWEALLNLSGQPQA